MGVDIGITEIGVHNKPYLKQSNFKLLYPLKFLLHLTVSNSFFISFSCNLFYSPALFMYNIYSVRSSILTMCKKESHCRNHRELLCNWLYYTTSPPVHHNILKMTILFVIYILCLLWHGGSVWFKILWK